MSKKIIVVCDLKKYFPVQKGFLERLLTKKQEYVHAVDGISFDIKKGEILGLVGESGSGKTTTGKLILRLLEPTGGKIFFNGEDISSIKGERLRRLRERMQIVFQDPRASLNPTMKIGKTIGSGLEIHGRAKGKEKQWLVLNFMRKVGLTPETQFYEKYPNQFSSGQLQRVSIAMVMILQPEFVVADEPVAMLDVSIRALILDLLLKMKEELNLTYLYITHDLATAKYVCDRVAIMYLGKIVEVGPIRDVFENPVHPYTSALLSAVPIPDPEVNHNRLILKGEIPNPINLPQGCRFHPRCPHALEKCSLVEPDFEKVEKEHLAACHRCRK
jgi:peptide/nickel transport system ATP-binding protein